MVEVNVEEDYPFVEDDENTGLVGYRYRFSCLDIEDVCPGGCKAYWIPEVDREESALRASRRRAG